MEQKLVDLLVYVAPGVAWTVVGQPFDLVRIRLAVGGGQYTGVYDCLRKTVRHEGVSAFWKGTTPALLLSMPTSMVMFSTYHRFRPSTPKWEDLSASYRAQVFGAGVAAGTPLTFFQNPLDVWRTRLQTNQTARAPLLSSVASKVGAGHGLGSSSSSSGINSSSSSNNNSNNSNSGLQFRDIVKRDPWVLYRGFPLLVARNFFGTGTFFSLYEWSSSWSEHFGLFGSENHQARALACGGFSGVGFTVLSYPLEVVRANMMNTDRGGVAATFQRLLREPNPANGNGLPFGWRALYRGVGVATIKALPVNAAGLWALVVVRTWAEDKTSQQQQQQQTQRRRRLETPSMSAAAAAAAMAAASSDVSSTTRRKTLTMHPSSPPLEYGTRDLPK